MRSHLRNANDNFNVFLTQNRGELGSRSNLPGSMVSSVSNSSSVLPEIQRRMNTNELIIKDIIRKVSEAKGSDPVNTKIQRINNKIST